MMPIQRQCFLFESEFTVRGMYPPTFWIWRISTAAKRASGSAVTSALNFLPPAAAAAVAVAAAAQSDSTLLDSPSKAKTCAAVPATGADAQGATSTENLVGSQKRKARKTKITHLVRTADGSVSPVEGE